MSARGGGNIESVVHLADSEVTQVLMGFGAGVQRVLRNPLQGWPVALGLVGA